MAGLQQAPSITPIAGLLDQVAVAELRIVAVRIEQGVGPISDDWANLIAAAEVTPADPTIDVRDNEPLNVLINSQMQ